MGVGGADGWSKKKKSGQQLAFYHTPFIDKFRVNFSLYPKTQWRSCFGEIKKKKKKYQADTLPTE